MEQQSKYLRVRKQAIARRARLPKVYCNLVNYYVERKTKLGLTIREISRETGLSIPAISSFFRMLSIHLDVLVVLDEFLTKKENEWNEKFEIKRNKKIGK